VVVYDQYFRSPKPEVATLLDFCGLRPSGGAVALSANIRPILSTSRAISQRFWRAIKYPIETKLLYLGLRGLESSGEISPSDDLGTDNVISDFLRLLDNSVQHHLVGGLQSRLNRSEAEFANLRTEMWWDIKANHRWGYRFYRKVLWPFQLSCYRSSQ